MCPAWQARELKQDSAAGAEGKMLSGALSPSPSRIGYTSLDTLGLAHAMNGHQRHEDFHHQRRLASFY